ncbi:two-component system CitB family sensor kinase/CitB family two-component system sensor histidine kinase CitS [Kroppenstedtia sanguinis]|uniref:histidine kinase n=1 Tax=Kroppenstedtia sanguinis TaxID=1380684 RepID=A0ABW4C5B3_9BACL
MRQRSIQQKNKHKPGLKRVTFNLKMKLIVAISVLIVGIFIIFSLFLHHFVSGMIEDQVGKRALGLAQTVADMPELQKAFEREDPAETIQELVEPIRKETGAQFIVVGNENGIRYSHPYTDRIGKKMVGGDNDPALQKGKSYVTKNVGSLGLSIRGKTPVLDADGHPIGVVSVGFLNEHVRGIVTNQSRLIWITMVLIICLGILGAILIAHFLKKLLSNMEPEEISYLLHQKEAILRSTQEGIISIDAAGNITMINHAAQDILKSLLDNPKSAIGQPIRKVLPHTQLFTENKNMSNREMIVGDHIVFVSQVPILDGDEVIGGVATLRKKQDMEAITNELNQIKQYAHAQRAQTHEFSNKLSIMLGLLQLGQYEEAISFIKQEQDLQHEWTEFLLKNVRDPLLSGLLQSKMNEANELNIHMTIQPESQLQTVWSGKKQQALLTGVGNLLDNAMEALKQQPQEAEKRVEIFFTDIGEDVLVEVSDKGPGIEEESLPFIFQQGFSTKLGEHRGTGLALVQYLIHEVGGEITVEQSDGGGACFVMTIPKEGE